MLFTFKNNWFYFIIFVIILLIIFLLLIFLILISLKQEYDYKRIPLIPLERQPQKISPEV